MDDFFPWLTRPWSGPFFYPDDPPSGDPLKDPPKDDPPKDPPKSVTFTAEQQEELNKIIGRARTEGHEAGKTAAETAAAAKKADEDGDHKTARELAEKKALDLEAELKKTRREALVAKIAAKYKLPEELEVRLQGDTLEDLEKDAKILAKVVQPRKAASTEAGEGDETQPTGPSNRPIKRERKPAGEGEPKPVKSYTFDRRPKVPWDQPT